MISKIFLILGLMSLSSFAHAGTEGGNGGNAAVCFQDSSYVKLIKDPAQYNYEIPNSFLPYIESIKILDLYEAEQERITPDGNLTYPELVTSSTDENHFEFIESIANRLKIKMPFLYERMMADLKRLQKSDIVVYDSMGITKVSDVGNNYYVDPEKCVIATMINRTHVGDGIKLEIDGRLFKHPKHSHLSQNVSMLHELIYLWTKFAPNARALVSVLLKANLNRDEVLSTLLNQKFYRSEKIVSVTSEYFMLTAMFKTMTSHLDKTLKSNGVDCMLFEQYYVYTCRKQIQEKFKEKFNISENSSYAEENSFYKQKISSLVRSMQNNDNEIKKREHIVADIKIFLQEKSTKEEINTFFDQMYQKYEIKLGLTTDSYLRKGVIIDRLATEQESFQKQIAPLKSRGEIFNQELRQTKESLSVLDQAWETSVPKQFDTLALLHQSVFPGIISDELFKIVEGTWLEGDKDFVEKTTNAWVSYLKWMCFENEWSAHLGIEQFASQIPIVKNVMIEKKIELEK